MERTCTAQRDAILSVIATGCTTAGSTTRRKRERQSERERERDAVKERNTDQWKGGERISIAGEIRRDRIARVRVARWFHAESETVQ